MPTIELLVLSPFEKAHQIHTTAPHQKQT